MTSQQIDISVCLRNFNFNPDSKWPDLLPAYCFGNELLCAFDRTNGPVFSLDDPSLLGDQTRSATQRLPALFKAIYPELGFFELIRLTDLLPQDHGFLLELWGYYGYRWKESLDLLAKKLNQLPLPIHRFLQNKKMGPQDLAPLRAMPSLEILAPIWPALMTSSFSKSEMTQALELIVELLLLGKTNEEVLPDHATDKPSTPSLGWLQKLKAHRFPKTTQQDQSADEKIRNLSWPLKSEARWARRGDLSGVELKLFFSHPQELQRALARLEQTCVDIQRHPELESLWSKN